MACSPYFIDPFQEADRQEEHVDPLLFHPLAFPLQKPVQHSLQWQWLNIGLQIARLKLDVVIGPCGIARCRSNLGRRAVGDDAPQSRTFCPSARFADTRRFRRGRS